MFSNSYWKTKRGRVLRNVIIAGVAGVILTPLILCPILGAIGFSSIGPVAGTLAAGIQSGIGSVATGSLFAMAQSVAMGAAIPAVFFVIGGAVTGVLGGAFTFFASFF